MTAGLVGRASDFSGPLRATRNLLEVKIARQFAQEVDPDGRPWQQLSSDYLKVKQGGSILVKTGELRDSFTFSLDKNSLSVMSSSKVFDKHDQGLDGMPQREILGLSAEDKNEIAGLTRRYIMGRKR
jgi:phage gpG-like protein